jgi:hypothetical protein
MEHLNGNKIYNEIEVFNMVRNGELKRYPHSFWSFSDGRIRAINILKYVLENILQWNDEDIIQNYDVNVFGKFKIRGILSRVFNSSPFEALNAVYPDKFQIWQFRVPNNYWEDDDNVMEAIRDIYENKLGIKSISDIYKITNHEDIFEKYGLDAIPRAQKKSIHDVIGMAYTGLEEEKFFKSSTSHYDLDKQIEIFKQKNSDNNLTHDDIIQMTAEQFKGTDLFSVAVKKHHLGIYEIVELAYPKEYKPWEFSYIGKGFWKNEENIVKAIKWLFEERLHIDPKTTVRISKEDFYNNSLGSLITYGNINRIRVKELIRLAYNDCDIIFKKKKSNKI